MTSTRLAALVAFAEQLGPDELEVLELVVAGLVRGREVYGELDLVGDRRDFAREALEEARDGLVYVAAGLVRARRAR